MAQLECKGIEELTKQLKNLQLNSEKDLIKDMLKAGEKPVVQAWKDSINRVTMPRGTVKTYVHIRRMKFHRFKMKSRSTGNTANAVAGNIRLNKTAVGTGCAFVSDYVSLTAWLIRHADSCLEKNEAIF